MTATPAAKNHMIETDYKDQPNNLDLGHIPGSYGLPLLGDMPSFVKDLRGLIRKKEEKYGRVSKFNIMGNKGVMVSGPDVMQEVLLDKTKNYSNEMGHKGTLALYFEGGILLRDFEEHKVQRRIFQTAFKNDPMRSYVHQMNTIMSNDMDSWQHINNFVLFPHIKKTLLTTAAKTFMNLERGTPEFDRLYKDYLDMLESMTSMLHWDIPGFKWHKGQSAKRDIFDYFRGEIPDRRHGDGTDFLSFFSREKMDNGEFFSEDDIIRHMNFLVFAAHDTTTASIINVLFELAKNEDLQEEIRKECQAYAKEHNKDALSYDDLDEIEILEYAMLEGQRMHPSVAMTNRRTIRETELAGHRIPPHTLLWLPLLSHYRDPAYWTNAETYDPYRFSPERAEHKAHSFLFVPFGGGAHKCIGMHFAKIQVKCFLYQFLQRYRFSVPADYDPWLMLIPMPKPADGLPLRLERIG